MRRVFSGVSVPSTGLFANAVCLRHIGSGGKSTCKQKDKLKRDPRYKTLTDSDVQFFKGVIGGNGSVITEESELAPYNTDWFQHYFGESKVCICPKTTEQIKEIMKYCNSEKLAVVPQGGNTNFVGGATPVFDEVVISMRKMNRIIEVDEVSATLKCEAGCILEPTDNYLKENHGLMMPVDLGAKGSCHIGGNVSTNAGGIRFMRYGSLHNAVVGLRVVLANGEELDMISPRKKDNTGYDLKHVFIGSEGTLGIVTEVALQLPTAPASIETMFLGLPSWDAVIKTFRFAKASLGEILSAVEMIDGDALDIVVDVDKTHSPLSERHRYYLLLEINGSNNEHDKAKLEKFLAESMEKELVVDGTLAENGKQQKHIWSMREGCAVAPNALGHVRWYDICMPTGKMEELVSGCRKRLEENGFGKKDAEVIAFGHLGDGNLHLNVLTKPNYRSEIFDVVDPYIYGFSRERDYSVSAEHGIGVQKLPYLAYSKSDTSIGYMRKMKSLWDPNGILNPYKVLAPPGFE